MLSHKQICQQAINHWMTNLLLCYAGEFDKVSYDGNNCAFCCYLEDCIICPLSQIGMRCDKDDSPWDLVVDAFYGDDNAQKLNACANMLRAVEKACDHLGKPCYSDISEE